jgi:hypothetical protein
MEYDLTFHSFGVNLECLHHIVFLIKFSQQTHVRKFFFLLVQRAQRQGGYLHISLCVIMFLSFFDKTVM